MSLEVPGEITLKPYRCVEHWPFGVSEWTKLIYGASSEKKTHFLFDSIVRIEQVIQFDLELDSIRIDVKIVCVCELVSMNVGFEQDIIPN